MPQEPEDESSGDFRRGGEADAWNALSLILSGMLVWGGVGWLLSRWLDNRLPLALGLVVGTAAGTALVWLRYGRQT
jgi:F0F1-type ATP synthase assembly protein I